MFSPVGDTGASTGGSGDATVFFSGALADLNKIGTVTTAHAVDTTDAQNGSTTPKIDASIPLIITTTLPDAVRTRPYSATIEAVGGKTPMSFFVASGTLIDSKPSPLACSRLALPCSFPRQPTITLNPLSRQLAAWALPWMPYPITAIVLPFRIDASTSASR